MKRNYFSILFFIKKTKLLKNGEAPICLRITVNGKRAEVQIKRSIEVEKWNSNKERADSKVHKHQELNHYLEIVRAKILHIHNQLEQENKPITAEILKIIYYGKKENPKMLFEVFNEHNKKCRELIGIDYVKDTVARYERTVRYLSEYLSLEYKQTDIPLKDINNAFIGGFEHYVKTAKQCNQNATIKYLKNLKKIVHLALANQWILLDPFLHIKFRQTVVNREFLLEEELQLLIRKEFSVPRLEAVRDIFVFCSFTGLAFTDVQKLKLEHIIRDSNGEHWIRKQREKTNNMCNIPLLDIPLALIEKYKDNPICQIKGVIFPVPSNQRMNGYLKEIADLCGIKKMLSTHIARHSFACLALANKVSMESIAKMLGHSDIRTTKIYAKILDSTISNDMQVLRQKFAR